LSYTLAIYIRYPAIDTAGLQLNPRPIVDAKWDALPRPCLLMKNGMQFIRAAQMKLSM
jgi:hypothetical protein